MASQSRAAALTALKTLIENALPDLNISEIPRHSDQVAAFPALDIGWFGGTHFFEVTQEYAVRESISLKLYSSKPDFSEAQAEMTGYIETITDALLADATLGDTCTGCWPGRLEPYLGFAGPPHLLFLALECELRRDYPQ